MAFAEAPMTETPAKAPAKTPTKSPVTASEAAPELAPGTSVTKAAPETTVAPKTSFMDNSGPRPDPSLCGVLRRECFTRSVDRRSRARHRAGNRGRLGRAHNHGATNSNAADNPHQSAQTGDPFHLLHPFDVDHPLGQPGWGLRSRVSRLRIMSERIAGSTTNGFITLWRVRVTGVSIYALEQSLRAKPDQTDHV